MNQLGSGIMSEITIKEEILDEEFSPAEEKEGSFMLSENDGIPNNDYETKMEDGNRLRTLLTQGLPSAVDAPEAVWIKEEPESDHDNGRMVDVDPIQNVHVKDEVGTEDGGLVQSGPEEAGVDGHQCGSAQQQVDGKPEGKPEQAEKAPKESTSARSKEFPCTVCGKVFGQKQVLKMHSMIHTGERPFPCSVCDRKFRKRAQLNIHSVTHTGVGAFSCTECNRSFGQKNCLTRHMVVHSGERPFTCSLCSKTFSRSGHYNEHMRIHSGVRPFPCNQCEKTFTHRASLTAHLRLHRGEQPYACDKCGKRFTQRGALTTHMRLHTGERPFACEKCGKTFVTKSNYTQHVRSHTRLKRAIAPRGPDGKVLEEYLK